jgi:hypothetical protein
MPSVKINSEAQEYRVALIRPGSSELLAIHANDGVCLPRIRVSLTDRPAEVLQRSLLVEWGVSAYVADYLPSDPCTQASPCVFGEVLESKPECTLLVATAEQLAPGEMSGMELCEFRLLLESKSRMVADVGRLGWLDEAYRWVETAIGMKLAGKDTVKQVNMGGGFVLLRMQALDGSYYWLKATSGSNGHEYLVTKCIVRFAGDSLPKIVASRDDWNAWLTEDVCAERRPAGPKVGKSSPAENAVRTLARIQAIGRHHVQDLLDVGAFDQRPMITDEVSRDLFDYLYECMELQQSQKTVPLDRDALDTTRDIYLRACEYLCDLGVPFTPLHGDLTGGNVASTEEKCRLLDWCETYVGFPIASLHHLRMFFERNGADDASLPLMNDHYRDEWRRWTGEDLPKESLRWAPLIAAASALYGRGNWLHNEAERESPARRSYSRTLARHMARAAQSVTPGAALCA